MVSKTPCEDVLTHKSRWCVVRVIFKMPREDVLTHKSCYLLMCSQSDFKTPREDE